MWQDLKADSDYKIFTEYPYPIKRKNTDRIVKEYIHHSGYICLKLNQKDYRKHRVIAQQFLDDFDENLVVDHISRDINDNRIENLRMVSKSINCKNISSKNGIKYKFIKELPKTAVPFIKYNYHEFENFYFDKPSKNMYYYNGYEYRIMLLHNISKNSRFVCMNKNNKLICIYLSKLNKMFA